MGANRPCLMMSAADEALAQIGDPVRKAAGISRQVRSEARESDMRRRQNEHHAQEREV